MLGGILCGLLCGWILALFNVDKICIQILQPITPFILTTAHYYFILGLIGLLYYY